MLAALEVIFSFSNHLDHFLTEPVSFRNYKYAAHGQLVQKELWDFRGRSSDQDSVEMLVSG